MSSYYSGRRARHYNTRWRTFTKRTLAEALAVIDEARLRRVPEQLGRPPRVLDVACGTGVLLRKVLDRVPGAEVYGVDASADSWHKRTLPWTTGLTCGWSGLKSAMARQQDRKSTRLNSSHLVISYAVFCLKKKIYQRSPAEVTMIAGRPIAPDQATALNPAFDVTPARYVMGFVTHRGIVQPPFSGES